jgi:hypothetical protein
LNKYGLAIDPHDPGSAVRIGQVADRQQGPMSTNDLQDEPEPKKETANAVDNFPQSAESFARETSSGAVGGSGPHLVQRTNVLNPQQSKTDDELSSVR